MKKDIIILYNVLMICLIVAHAHNNVIGNKGIIPWDLPDDRQHFKELTLGGVVIMGRRTFEEIYKKFGKGLPERETIVISRKQNLVGENYRTVASLQAAIELAKKDFSDKDIFICGGESVYKEALKENLVEKMYITEIDMRVEGDAFFPEFNKDSFIIEERIKSLKSLPHEFLTYRHR